MTTPVPSGSSFETVSSAPPLTEETVMNLLRGVIDPELGSDIVELGMAKKAVISPSGEVVVTVALTTSGCPLRAQLQKDVKTRVGAYPGVTSVKIDWTEMTQAEKARAMAAARWNKAQDAPLTAVSPTTKVICIASGKGGVGKSSVTVNLAVALAARGLRVGVLDADIWGFSIPRMLGLEGRLQGAAGVDGAKQIAPHTKTVGAGRLEVVSMGFLVDHEDDALMWRGLILNRAVQHFLEDVQWGELDYLLIDMPPGTGDVQMGLARMLPRAEMIIVTTPAKAAQMVAARAATMARKCYLRVAGVIENMSEFHAPDGQVFALFGRGGGEALAAEVGAPLLGCVPIEQAVAEGGDAGQPVALGEGPAADAFRAIAAKIVEETAPPVAMAGCSARMMEAALAALDALDAEEAAAGA
ncbi:MAG: Mrp/NBP35 family ATP-binding protein [Acidimicrobiales bacterium]